MEQKYSKDSLVYTYYFDWETTELVYKELFVANYEYMDGPQWNIIDEYKLIEFIATTKWWVFKTLKPHIHRIKGHLISDDLEYARAKFLYHFLQSYKDIKKDFVSPELVRMVDIALPLYNEMVEIYPDVVYRAITEKLSEDGSDSFWRD